MEPITLSIDILLRTIIGSPQKTHDLINRAKSGRAYFVVSDFALCCALYSVENSDTTNLPLLAELLRYSQIECETPDYIETNGRSAWTPSQEEIQRWRAAALDVV